jgi:hypothetical protein
VSSRNANEKRFKQWSETENGGRSYSRKVIGQYGWYAVYIKDVNADEEIISFRQEIYNEEDKLIEIHEKYPIDKGHRKIN